MVFGKAREIALHLLNGMCSRGMSRVRRKFAWRLVFYDEAIEDGVGAAAGGDKLFGAEEGPKACRLTKRL
jgi:hypothetical protein